MSTSRNCAFALVFFFTIGLAPAALRARCVAYSLNRAEQELGTQRSPTSELTPLGGITRPLGIVCDESAKDLILVGHVDERNERLTLDDLVVALRAVLKYDFVPAVSIDIAPDTEQTGMQTVRFEGRIERTRWAQDLLAADVVLKKLGMGMLSTGEALPSYFDMRVANWRETGLEDCVRSRFWFLPSKRSYVAVRDGVVVINRFELDVGVEVLTEQTIGASDGSSNGGVPTDEVGSQFAQTLVTQQRELCQKYPELRRLEPLFRFVGLAQGIARLRKKEECSPDLTYWLDDYRVSEVETATEYPLLLWENFLRQGDETVRMIVEGGIDLETLVLEFSDGDAQAFKEVVLLSKPKGDPLVWNVPLAGWPGLVLDDNEADGAAEQAIDLSSHPLRNRLGTTLVTRFEKADVRDNMQQRLASIGMTQTQRDGLYFLQQEISQRKYFPGGPGGAAIAPSPFKPTNPPSFPANKFPAQGSSVLPATLEVPKAIALMDQMQMPPLSLKGSDYTTKPLVSKDSPLDMAWTAVHGPGNHSLSTWNGWAGDTETIGRPLMPNLPTFGGVPFHRNVPSVGLSAAPFRLTVSPKPAIPNIHQTLRSYHQANPLRSTIQSSYRGFGGFGGGPPRMPSPSPSLSMPRGIH